MNFFKLISDLERLDAEVYERFDTRRRAFRYVAGLGRKLSAAALPAVVGLLFTKAYGQTSGGSLPPAIAGVLNLALQLEYLEYYFYDAALQSGSLLAAADRAAITAIRNDESGHIKVLQAALGSQALPATPPRRTDFDYTAGGSFADFTTNADVFYALAQSFEDLGVRAYKGGAPRLIANKTLLEVALNIHSVEARHAAHLRTVRRGRSAGVSGAAAAQAPFDLTNLVSKPKNWVSGTDGGGAAAAATAAIYGAGSPAVGVANQVFYPAEDAIIQVGINVETTPVAPAGTGLKFDAASASEAFDEGLNESAVKDIAMKFRSATGVTKALFQ